MLPGQHMTHAWNYCVGSKHFRSPPLEGAGSQAALRTCQQSARQISLKIGLLAEPDSWLVTLCLSLVCSVSLALSLSSIWEHSCLNSESQLRTRIWSWEPEHASAFGSTTYLHHDRKSHLSMDTADTLLAAMAKALATLPALALHNEGRWFAVLGSQARCSGRSRRRRLFTRLGTRWGFGLHRGESRLHKFLSPVPPTPSGVLSLSPPAPSRVLAPSTPGPCRVLSP